MQSAGNAKIERGNSCPKVATEGIEPSVNRDKQLIIPCSLARTEAGVQLHIKERKRKGCELVYGEAP